MPVMTKLRDSMPVVFAILAALFLLMIIFQWGGQGSLFSGGQEAGVLGSVNGRKITQKDYDRIYQNVVEKTKTDAKKSSLTESEEEQAAAKAWDETVKETLIQISMDKMGITVTDQDVRDVLFENPPQELRQGFIDSATGIFDEKRYVKALRDPAHDSEVRIIETSIRENLRRMKWQAALISTIVVTDDEAKHRYIIDSAKAQVQVLKFPAPQVTPDLAKQVTDKEIQDYYNAHLWQYKQEESRKFKFVAFREAPNARDSATARETAKTIESRLHEAAPNEIDTVAKNLALDYSDEPYISPRPVTMRDVGTDTALMNARPGDVAATTIARRLTVVRVLDVKDSGAPLLHVRHLVIGMGRVGPKGIPIQPAQASQSSRDSAFAYATQLAEKLRAGADFPEMAHQHSEDAATAIKGGDMGWNDTAYFPPPYRKSIAAASVNSIIGPTEGPMGYEIMQVAGRSSKTWTVVGVPLSIKPSRQTLQLDQQMANIFHDQAAKNGFDEAAKNAGYKVVTDAPAASKKGAPIFTSHTFVDWIFAASKGDVSAPITITDGKFILVAQLTEIIPAGAKPLEMVKTDIVNELAKRKGIEALSKTVAQFRNMVAPTGDMGAVAAQTRDSNLLPKGFFMGPAESVNGIPTGEYVVNNWAFAAKPGQVSPVLKGENGCYIVKLIDRKVPSDADFKGVRKNFLTTLHQERLQRLMLEYIDKQKDDATIVDYRTNKH